MYLMTQGVRLIDSKQVPSLWRGAITQAFAVSLTHLIGLTRSHATPLSSQAEIRIKIDIQELRVHL